MPHSDAPPSPSPRPVRSRRPAAADLARARVLLVEDSPTYATAITEQLSSLGLPRVEVVFGAEDALRCLMTRAFDIVLSEYALHDGTAVELLEVARGRGWLGADTLFVAMSAVASYSAIGESRQAQVDDFLIKPLSAQMLGHRFSELLARRAALGDIQRLQSRGELQAALSACDVVIEGNGPWAAQAMQLKANLLLRLGRFAECFAMHEAALQLSADHLPSRLALAQAHRACGQIDEAGAMAREMIHSPGGYRCVEALDLLAACMDDQGEADAALQVLRRAAMLFPTRRRLRTLGDLAYRERDMSTATEAYARLVRRTLGSIAFDATDACRLAQTYVDDGEVPKSMGVLQQLSRRGTGQPECAGLALSIRSQALARADAGPQALECLRQARDAAGPARPDLATMALAKAELLNGQDEEGLRLLKQALAAQPDDRRARQVVHNALVATQRQHLMDQVIDQQRVHGLIHQSLSLFREQRIDEALQQIAQTTREFPQHTEVLLHAAKLLCMAMRLRRQRVRAWLDLARQHLGRLETLAPGDLRVEQARRYFDETLGALGSSAGV